MGDRLEFTWGVARHLLGVRNSDALREAYEAVQPDVVRFGLRVGQSRPIYDRLQELRQGADFERLEPAQQRIVETLLRDARHTGVGLDGEARERFNAIAAELAELSTTFGNHVLDATKAWSSTAAAGSEAEVEGLPASQLRRPLRRQAAREAGEADASAPRLGPWRTHTRLRRASSPSWSTGSPRRELREELYRAYVSRARERRVRQRAPHRVAF